MMKKETQQRFERLREFFGDRLFTEKELLNDVPAEAYVSMSTLRKYDLVECVKVETKQEYSLDELIAEINEMIGEDCYGGTIIITAINLNKISRKAYFIIAPIEHTFDKKNKKNF